jgi:YbbR domain-containing protein
MKKSQSSIEAALVITFMLFVLAVFVGIMAKKSGEITNNLEFGALKEVIKIVERETLSAQKAEDGYTRLFSLPELAEGIPYNLTLTNSTLLNATNPNHFEVIADATNYRDGLVLVELINGMGSGKLCNNNSYFNQIRKVNKGMTFKCIEK